MSGRFTLPLLLLFTGSGCAALIYEVVWFHLLRFVIGASAVSLGILLASFMGGMFLGSLLFYRFVSASRHPLRVYAALELGIGVFGLLIPVTLPLIGQIYTELAGYGYLNIVIRGAICAVCLLPPTMLMGATLPAIARWMERSRTGAAQLGFFYGANIFGAVIGTLAAGFYLLRFHDVMIASGFAVSINFAVAIIGFLLARRQQIRIRQTSLTLTSGRHLLPIYIAIGLSGFAALGSQVVWTRLLSLLFGATVYTFSVILGVFLIGLGIGSALGASRSRDETDPAIGFGLCQFLLVAGVSYAGYAINSLIPGMYVIAANQNWLVGCVNDLLRCSIAILPATVLWGASFPFAVAAVGLERDDPGKQVGRLYAANTVGAIIGALLFSLIVIPQFGTRVSQQGLTATSALAGLIIVLPILWKTHSVKDILRKRSLKAAASGTVVFGTICITAILTYTIPEIHAGMIGYGRQVDRWNEPDRYVHSSEGINASVAVSVANSKYRNFHVAGKIVASTWPEDMRLQRMLGHIPSLIHPNPKSVLIIGFGAGVTAGTFTLYPHVERIVIVEIEPEVVSIAGQYFASENLEVLHDPRTEVIFDDARHFISTTTEKFDIITADPIHPWVKGAAALYTQEFFDLCKDHLNPGGVITQWVPFYETSEAAVKSEIATLFKAFSYGSVWNSDEYSTGYDVTVLGHMEPLQVDAARIQGRIDANQKLKDSLSEVSLASAMDILKTYAGRKTDIQSWLTDAQLNLDRNLRLEYLAGEALDDLKEDDIYSSMTHRLPYPEGYFVVSEDQEKELRDWLAYYSE